MVFGTAGLVARRPVRFASSVDARDRIRALAAEAGFELVRFADAAALSEPRAAVREALDAGRLADMGWMTEEWIERATAPEVFLEGARTVVLLALPAHAPDPPREGARSRGRIARYARGRDYHRVFESKLRGIVRAIREELGAEARATVDYGPLLERPLAARAGLGWLGKSTMLLAPGFGPWVLLGAIATTLAIESDQPLRKSCGSCTRCIVACPTGAIAADGGVLDSRLCISYHTIESRAPIPRELRSDFGDWIFGCDDCLDSCPVGAANTDSHPDLVSASSDDAFPPLAELLELDDAAFRERFRGRAIQRATRDGFLRNVCVALGNVGAVEDIEALASALVDDAALVRGHAAWALGELARQHGASDRVRPVLQARAGCEEDAWVGEELTLALAASNEAERAR